MSLSHANTCSICLQAKSHLLHEQKKTHTLTTTISVSSYIKTLNLAHTEDRSHFLMCVLMNCSLHVQSRASTLFIQSKGADVADVKALTLQLKPQKLRFKNKCC